MYVERAGGQWEAARVELLAGGRFVIATSACAHGQGHETTFAQLAAQRLRVDPDAITIRYGDSAEVPEGVGTFGSRSVAMAGSAIVVAIDELIELARARLGDGAREIAWAQLPPMSAEARFESPLVFSSGAHAATVAIDPATGALRVLHVAAVDDAGTVINPTLVHGQVVGGVAQAVGECLVEEVLGRRAARLQASDRGRDAGDRDRRGRKPDAAEPARGQGCRRGRGGRRAARDRQRGRRRARRAPSRPALHGREAVAGAAR